MMAVIHTYLTCDLQKLLKVQYLDGNLFSQDNQANEFHVTVTDNGEPATISGSVTADVIRSDGGTVAVTGGTISGNVASITFPAAVYAVPGVVSIVVKLTASGVVTTIAAAVANVYQSSTETAVDPGTIIPSIQTLISSIEAAVASIPADYSALWTSLAPAFSSSASYVAGQYCTYNGAVYRFNTSHTGSWAAGDVTAVNIGGELSALKSAINKNNGELAQLPQQIGVTLYRAIPADTGHGLVDSTTRVTSGEFVPCAGDTVSISSGYYFRILYYNNGGYSSFASWTQSWTAASAFAPNGARIQVKKGSAGTDTVTAEEVYKVLTCYLRNVSNTMLVPSNADIAGINQNMALKADKTQIVDIERVFPDSYYQLIDLNTAQANKVWNESSGNIVRAAVNDCYSFDPIILPAGTYTCNKIYANKTYLVYSSDNSIETFKNAYPYQGSGSAPNNYGRTFTLEEAVTLYLSTEYSINPTPMICTGDSVPSTFKTPGKYYTSIDDKMKVDGVELGDIVQQSSFDFSKYITAYIHNEMLVGNSNKGAKYTQADMGSKCKKMMCRFKLRSVNNVNKGCVTLITLNNRLTNDNSPTNDIGNGSVHVTFTATNVQVGMYYGTDDIIKTISYSSALVGDEETEYEAGIEFLGSGTLKIYLPDGTNDTATDSRVDEYNGRYVIWEHYTQSFDEGDYPEVTEQMPQVLITGFYCRCENNVELRDNFHRENGAVGVAPSGQPYRTWANRGSNPTIYDNV